MLNDYKSSLYNELIKNQEHAFQIVEVEQRTLEWYQLRTKYLTASNAKEYNKKTPSGINTTIDKITKAYAFPEAVDLSETTNIYYKSKSIERGIIGERYAFEYYKDLIKDTGHELKSLGFCISNKYTFLACSPDGVVCKDGKVIGAIEIKSPELENHALALSGQIPEDYKWQMVHQCLVLGVEWVDYVSFNPNYNLQDCIKIIRYTPHDKDILSYLSKVEHIWQSVQNQLAKFKDKLNQPDEAVSYYNKDPHYLEEIKKKLKTNYINYSGLGQLVENRQGIEEETAETPTPTATLAEREEMLKEYYRLNPEALQFANSKTLQNAIKQHQELSIENAQDVASLQDFLKEL